MNEEALDRVQFFTRHFNDLQGLRLLVPLGLIALSFGGAIHFGMSPAALLGSAALGALLLRIAARRHYRRAFGVVEPRPAYPSDELHGLSIYSPAGPVSRLQGFQQMTPITRHFLATILLMVGLCWIFQLATPGIQVWQGESARQHPRIGLRHPYVYDEDYLGWMSGLDGLFKTPSGTRAIYGQMAYAFCGAIFLGLWLWRERRRSQSHHLTLAVLLLGLAAASGSLGFLARSREIPPLVDLVLPALVYPGVALLLCGGSLILAGLIDHWELARALGTSAMEEPS